MTSPGGAHVDEPRLGRAQPAVGLGVGCGAVAHSAVTPPSATIVVPVMYELRSRQQVLDDVGHLVDRAEAPQRHLLDERLLAAGDGAHRRAHRHRDVAGREAVDAHVRRQLARQVPRVGHQPGLRRAVHRRAREASDQARQAGDVDDGRALAEVRRRGLQTRAPRRPR